MLVSQLVPAVAGYPVVRGFVMDVLDPQFSDVRAMLQLPRPDVGILPGCNFAIVSTLCNLLSGISTTIFKPANLHHEVRSQCGSGRAFRGLVAGYYPATPAGTAEFPHQLYELCRNPLAHSVGLRDAVAPVVTFTRVLDASHPERGWSDQELENLERPDRPFRLHSAIAADANNWTLYCDSFYLDVIELLRRLIADSVQANAAGTISPRRLQLANVVALLDPTRLPSL